MTPASATRPVHLQLAFRPCVEAADDGLYGLAQRWPAWARLSVIGALGVAVWASVIVTAWPLLG